ncbi:hypothetical protein AB0O01_14250 [Streptomyces sp. NPDC093252]|uniref:hypothetical protein n=1 Tax=Streptomyces sp. NPDC093252 TaxID=3154980 RepID=UPI0034460D2C
MTGRGRAPISAVTRGAALSVLLVTLVGLVSCGRTPAPDTGRADVQRLLDRRAGALLAGDTVTYRATGTPTNWDNLGSLPLAAWSYRVTGLAPADGTRATDTFTADAELSYRLQGYDRAPVTTARTLTLTRDRDGDWRLTADRPAEESGQQLWDQGPVQVIRGTRSLILGVGRTPQSLRDFAALADRAVPAVSGAWGTDWGQHVLVLVPKSLDGMAGLLGSPASHYRGIAAVTTGEVGADGDAPADRIVINPDAYAILGDTGKQVVLTHETTHVATRAHTDAATPLWLSEGYADWTGYRGTGRTPAEIAPELARAVASGELPKDLPADDDFGFTDDPATLARAYESGWLAARMIAEHWGAPLLADFYRAVAAHGQREGAVSSALTKVLGVSEEQFTEEWREYLVTQLPAG